jgi:hypothetical protein
MATKNEKIVGTILGIGIGGFMTYNKQIDQVSQNKEPISIAIFIKGLLLGGLGGYSFATIFGSPNDTVNYSHYFKGKRVYEGITYEERFEKRMKEHKRNGKRFTKVIKDSAKPRIEALKIEKERINTFSPINNILHNNKSNI